MTNCIAPTPAAPADAVSVTEWDCDGMRGFLGTERTTGAGVRVDVVGTQRADGSVERVIVPDLSAAGGGLTAAQAMDLIHVLADAVTELEGLR